MNIVLIGYRGAGKSVVGKGLADRLRRKFIDTDHLIEERHGAPINDIVKSQGWEHFRKLEKGIIEEVSKGDHLIIASGGGVVLDPENVMALRRNGIIIWLKADRQVLQKRMDQDPKTVARRPTLTGKGILEELEEMISVREPFYERASEIQIDTSMLDVDTVVERILTIFDDKIRIG